MLSSLFITDHDIWVASEAPCRRDAEEDVSVSELHISQLDRELLLGNSCFASTALPRLRPIQERDRQKEGRKMTERKAKHDSDKERVKSVSQPWSSI